MNSTCRHEKELQGIFDEVKNSAYEIIEKKGETSYGIGLAMVRITQAILNDENAVMPVSSLINGYLGIDDLYLSLPAVVNKEGVREVFKINLETEEEEAMINSANTIKNIKNISM